MVLSQHLPKKWKVDLPESKDLVSASSWAVWPWASPSASFFFFLSHFHNYKNESWPRSEDKFYLWPSPKNWRSCLQHCVGRIWRGIQLSRKEGHDLLPLAQVQEHGWRRVRYCLTWTRCFLFFFFLIFIYFWLHWVLVATCRTFPCSVWALWLWLVGSRVPGLSSRPA